MKNFFKFAIVWPCFLVVLVFLTNKTASAAIIEDQKNLGHNDITWSTNVVQSFLPGKIYDNYGIFASSTNFAGISLGATDGGGAASVYLTFGVCWLSKNCSLRTVLATSSVYTDFSNTLATTTFLLDTPHDFEYGYDYYYFFWINEYIPGQTLFFYRTNLDYYTNGQIAGIGAGGQDLNFVTLTNITTNEITQNPDFNLINWRSDIRTVEYQLCFIGDNCRLWFSFNDKAIGNNVFLTPDQQFKQSPAYALATTTIIYDPRWQNYINTPDQTTATKTDYCLFMIDNTYGDLLNCGITIEWVSSSTFASDIFNKLDIAHACDTVSSSSGSFFDDFRYGLECGLRKISFWAFTPTPDSVKYFFESSQKIKTVFPFNTYFSLTSAAQVAIASTSLSADNTIGLPMITTAGNYYILPVLASSSMSNAIGQTNTNTFRNTLGWLMWLIVAALVFFTFKKI